MKKRILALALAATTAFSMFGASLSVSADYAPTGTAGELVDSIVTGTYMDGSDADYATFKDEMDTVAALIEEDETVTPKDGMIYAYDYTAATWEKFAEALENAQNAEDGTSKYYGEVYYPMLAKNVEDTAKALDAEKSASYTVSDLRKVLLDEVAAAKKEANNLDPSDYKDGEEKVAAVKATVSGLTETSLNSVMVYGLACFDAAMAGLTLADEEVDPFDALQAQIDRAEAILAYRDEYKTTATANKYFDAMEEKLDAAYAIIYDYSVLNSKVKSATTALKAACDKVESYALPASAEAKNALAAAIAKADACKDDPAGYDTTSDTDAVKAFTKAYNDAKAASAKSEHVVVEATEALLNAIDGLKVTAAKASYALSIQEDLVDTKISGIGVNVFDLVETDFTAASWAKFEVAMDLYDAAVTMKEYDTAKAKVLQAANALVKVSVRAAKAEFTSVKNEAISLNKDAKLKATKSKAAVDAFEAAVKKATEANPLTVSQYEAATSALEAAIKAYKDNKVVEAYEGWAYDNGTWYFYVKGEKAIGWTWDGKNWYYMDDKGVMQTGWQQLDGAWYYLYSWGGMAKGWAQVNGTWYYLNPNGGKMLSNGWNWIEGKCYYFYSWGGMAANTTIDGYKVDATGAWVK